MRRALIPRNIFTRLYATKKWAGVLIDSSDFGPGGASRVGTRVAFMYYDGSPFCDYYSLTFKTEEEAMKFTEWHSKVKPHCVYDKTLINHD